MALITPSKQKKAEFQRNKTQKENIVTKYCFPSSQTFTAQIIYFQKMLKLQKKRGPIIFINNIYQKQLDITLKDEAYL